MLHGNRLIFLFLFLFLLGCSSNEMITPKTNQVKKVDIQPASSEQSQEMMTLDPIKEHIKNMTLEEKVGHLIMVGIPDAKLSEKVLEQLEKYRIKNIILFTRNISNRDNLEALIKSLRDLDESMFIAIDEEGGEVQRLRKVGKVIPSAKTIGRSDDPKAAYQMGVDIADNLIAFEIDMTFAPVLDVLSNPNNKVIGTRSFGSNPQKVALFSSEVIKGLQDKGIRCVGKHFLAHGKSSGDTHKELVKITESMGELQDDLLPYIEAIKNNVSALMISHLTVDAIDSNKPLSLSPKTYAFVREELNFQGVLFSDDMIMNAISKEYGIQEGIVQFLISGGDIAILSEFTELESSLNSIYQAIEEKELTEDMIDEKVGRILRMKGNENYE